MITALFTSGLLHVGRSLTVVCNSIGSCEKNDKLCSTCALSRCFFKVDSFSKFAEAAGCANLDYFPVDACQIDNVVAVYFATTSSLC